MTIKDLCPDGSSNLKEKLSNGTLHGALSEDERTDVKKWRLLDERGRQTWHYLSSEKQAKAWPQSTVDRYHLGLPLV